MRVRSNAIKAALAGLSAALAAPVAEAQVFGGPTSGGIGFLPANSEIADGMFWFHNSILLPAITGISLLVLALIIYIVWRFNETANPVPSRRTHNAMLEFAWTVAPALILVIIAVPSFRLLAQQLIIPAPDLTLKVTASQWHWNYGYPKSEGGFSFDSLYVEEKDLKPGQPQRHHGRPSSWSFRSARWWNLTWSRRTSFTRFRYPRLVLRSTQSPAG